MLLRIVFVLEILSAISCIHCVYGKKIKINIQSISLFLCLLVIMEIVNFYQLKGLFFLCFYIPILIYCKRVFGKTKIQTLINFIIFAVVLTSIEFMSIMMINMFFPDDLTIRNVIQNAAVLSFCILVLPKCHVDKIQTGVNRRNKTTVMLIIAVTIVIFALILQGKTTDRIKTEVFVLAVPVILIMLWLLVKWNTSQSQVESMEKEREMQKALQEEYDKLLLAVRLRQHEFKNHLAAILSSHYTHKTYEKLVKAQDEYCSRIKLENKYNNLLLIGDKLLAGFLYGKFLEMEEDGIIAEYKVAAQVKEYGMLSYYLIEIIGILLDNAVEAVKKREGDKRIVVCISEDEKWYYLSVRNPFQYVSYGEIAEWFKAGISSKGKTRGLGLYHVKELCQEWGSRISCRNRDIQGENWIEFELGIPKADSK